MYKLTEYNGERVTVDARFYGRIMRDACLGDRLSLIAIFHKGISGITSSTDGEDTLTLSVYAGDGTLFTLITMTAE